MFTYDSLLEVFKFLRQNDLAKLEWTNKWTRNLVEANKIYWPLNCCYRLTFLEYYAGNTLSRVPNLNDFPFQLKPTLQRQLEQSELPANGRVPLFLDVTEPTFLLFEFSSGRKFYVEFEPFLDGQNMEKLIFWLDQIANVFFEEEIRGLLDIRKFHPELLEWLNASGFGKLMHFRCKTFGCYEYEAFDQSSIKFVMDHMSVQCLDKANGTIYSPELVQFLHNGADCCQSFSTRWVMGCGPEFTDNLIQHALNTESPHKMVPNIRITPSSHRQRELPIPRSLVPSEKIWLIKREFGDWKYEEWEIENSGGGGQMPAIRFRLCLFLFDDLETDEQAISQFSIKRI